MYREIRVSINLKDETLEKSIKSLRMTVERIESMRASRKGLRVDKAVRMK